MSKTSCHFASILAVVVLLGGHAEARFSSPIIQLASRQLTNKETFGARQFQGRHTGLPVPPPLVALSDAEGQQIFREALLGDGNLKAFFPLVQELVTQATESYCGVATLLTSLNALGVDPGRAWSPKVPDWDWYGDVTMLNGLAVNGTCVGGDVCCLAREAIDYMGTCLSQLACIARANGLDTDLFLWGTFTVDDFRHHLASMSDSELVALNFDRRGLGQEGGGHFSPIAGYNSRRDMVLVLDVARYKYVPWWAPVGLVYESMSKAYSGSRRGFAVLRRSADGPVMPAEESPCLV
uniref:glutathione gamma-glutamylcysteinyltransferase n=1 Tax=Tetraselmis sp. GSL018 TaxID=582737 RepID=A0A061QZH9_9CHLO|mmetsp:Transcript_31766/g.75451  ORF Transcript_31766/g.75451 Transcript_31766/m.75451 type:complete len:295 (+) Transcript_31766:145-1029(+)